MLCCLPRAWKCRHSGDIVGAGARVPGLSAAGVDCRTYSRDELNVDYIVANPSVYGSVAAREPRSSEAAIFDQAAPRSACTKASIIGSARAKGRALDKPVLHTWVQDNEDLISGFSFCYERKASVFYSPVPMDFYLALRTDNFDLISFMGYNDILNYHVNALAALTNDNVSC